MNAKHVFLNRHFLQYSVAKYQVEEKRMWYLNFILSFNSLGRLEREELLT